MPYKPRKTLAEQEINQLQDWLNHINERDPELIDDFWYQVHNDPAAKEYFLMRSVEAKPTDTPKEEELVTLPNEVKCSDCRHFNPHPSGSTGDCGKGIKPAAFYLYAATKRNCDQFRPISN